MDKTKLLNSIGLLSRENNTDNNRNNDSDKGNEAIESWAKERVVGSGDVSGTRMYNYKEGASNGVDGEVNYEGKENSTTNPISQNIEVERRKNICQKLGLSNFRLSGKLLRHEPTVSKDDNYEDLSMALQIVDRVAKGVTKGINKVSNHVKIDSISRHLLYDSNTDILDTRPKISLNNLNPGHIRSRCNIKTSLTVPSSGSLTTYPVYDSLTNEQLRADIATSNSVVISSKAGKELHPKPFDGIL